MRVLWIQFPKVRNTARKKENIYESANKHRFNLILIRLWISLICILNKLLLGNLRTNRERGKQPIKIKPLVKRPTKAWTDGESLLSPPLNPTSAVSEDCVTNKTCYFKWLSIRRPVKGYCLMLNPVLIHGLSVSASLVNLRKKKNFVFS